jgi:hypothetical protein
MGERSYSSASFLLKGNLKNHVLKVHGGTKPFKCDKPDEQSNRNLKNHISSVHERNKNCSCSICNIIFADKSTMNLNAAIVHERNIPSFT